MKQMSPYRTLNEDEKCVLEYKVIMLSREIKRFNEFKNLVHGSDSKESVKFEIKRFFL